MPDPISVISLIEGSIGLVVQCGSVAKTLSDMITKFKHAEVAIISLIQEVETIQFAWDRIKEGSEEHAEAATDSQFVQRLEKSLQCGTLVLSALEQDLANYKHTADNASFKMRSKMAWNERAFLDHQHRVRGQVQAMTLMLQVSQLSTSKAQTKLLKKKEKAFRASDESAYSIVPSRMSSHMSVSTRSRDSVLTIESQELVYYPLSFEDDLFTARVYKRNYRNPWMNSLVKFHWGKKMEERRVPTANPEASEDGQSLLSSSTGTTTPTIMSVDFSQPWPSNQETSLPDLRPVSPGPALTAETKADLTGLEQSVMISGSVPSTSEESPSIGSSLLNGTPDTSTKQIYPAGGQSDISGAISPTPGYVLQIDSESNVAVAPPSPAPGAQYEMNHSLLLAVEEGKLDDVKTLIHRGAALNGYHVNMPPLHLAVHKRDVSMMRLLLQEGADYAQGWAGTPSIHLACIAGDFLITRLLLDAGASATSLDAVKQQPLHSLLSDQSARSDASDVVDLLMSRGADIHARTCTNETPLHRSCRYPSFDNIRALLVHGANINTEDRDGNTPFHTFVTEWTGWLDSGCFEAILQLLLQHGVNLDAQNGAGDTPLHIIVATCIKRRFKVRYEAHLQLLLEHGVNVNAQNRNGDTPLHLLFTAGVNGLPYWGVDQAVLHSLIEHGAQVNIQNVASDTPLHIVARHDHSLEGNAEWRIQLIRGLFDAGADLSVNMQNVAGDTPLHIVARCVHSVERNAEWSNQLIHGLLDAGADLYVRNRSEESAWQLLEQVKDRSVLRKAALARPPQKSMSEGDEDEIGVAY